MNKFKAVIWIILIFFSVSVTAQTKKTNDNAKPKIVQQKEDPKKEIANKIIADKKGPDGQSVYEGAKGGLYYINKSGNKIYLKDTDSVVAGKTGPDGQPVYKGPQGGEYYYNKCGVKAYLKK